MDPEIFRSVWPKYVGQMVLVWSLTFALVELWIGPIFNTLTILVMGAGSVGALVGMLEGEARRRKKRSHKL